MVRLSLPMLWLANLLRAQGLTIFVLTHSLEGIIYMDHWDPWNGEVLSLEREPTNPEDQFAVAIKISAETVGHVPFNLSPIISAFLKRSCNKGLVEVMGN